MKHKTILLSALSMMSIILSSCGTTTFDNTKLVIGLECGYAPFNWSETTENEYTLKVDNIPNLYCDGYDIQIAKLLGEELGFEVHIMKTEWESLVSDLQFGAINAIIAGMTDTEERRQSISFTDEYYRSELVLITAKSIADQYDHPLTSEELSTIANGQVFVSQTSTVTDEVIDIFKENYGAIHATPLKSFALAATDVSNGTAFAMTAELPVAQSIVASFNNLGIIHINQDILGEKQAELGVSIGIQKGNTELQSRINAALNKITIEERTEMMRLAVERSSAL